ncbi:MAG: T9SS type A sorting domain-containing protein [Bacteroidetes bacterium]|nr:T9SS type A sorting domain-containing protein [Bacteroidota bacterium]
MKTKVLSAISFALFFGSTLFAQTSGGPDAYGYVWKNSADVAGPAYLWNDIKATGTQITGLGDDNVVANIQLNWPFHFYWTDYNKITVGSNGWIGFPGAPANIAAPFPTLPNSGAAKNTICPLLADLTFTKTNSQPVPGTSAWYWSNNVDTMIVQYDSVPYWVNTANGFAGRYTFQVILSGADSSITFQYKVATAGTPAYTASEGSATGISNSTGTIGLQVLPSLTFPTALTAVKFYYPNPVTYQVYDATPNWNQNTANGGFFVSGPYAAPLNMTTDIGNAGNSTIGGIGVMGQLFDISLSQVWTSSASVSSLLAGADTVITYGTPYTSNTFGTYIYRTTTSNATPADMNPGNDITDVEMVVVDTTLATVGLSYVTATTATTGNGWGGNGGQGIYVEPPFYPATVVSVEYFPVNTGTNAADYHLTQINDDDGVNNSAGTLLFNDSISATATIINQWNVKTLVAPLTVTSGGIYVSWLENGDSLSNIGTDPSLPLSNRNYEIIGGNWAAFRNNSAEDLMIKVNIQGSNTVGTSNLNENVFSVSQNYPNPSATYTNINFTLSSGSDVAFTVRNIMGQEVDGINFGSQSAGMHTIKLNTAKLSSGIYFYTVKAGDNQITRKMIVSK